MGTVYAGTGHLAKVNQLRRLALAVLSAREFMRYTAFRARQSEPGAAGGANELLQHLGILQQLLMHVHECARVSIEDFPVASKPVDLTRITTLHPRTYNEARTIGEHFREGSPVILNLTEMVDSDAKRLVDFAAGLIFGLRGSIDRVTNKVFILSPAFIEVTAEDKARIAERDFFNQPEAGAQAEAETKGHAEINAEAELQSKAEAKAADYPHTALAAADAALQTVEDLIAIIARPYEGVVPEANSRRLVANQLQELSLPLDLSGIDLTGITLHLDVLAGAIWSSDTQWPGPDIAAHVLAISEELSPGTYRIRTGTQRDPSGVLLPV